jgi:hypothetical protein
MKMKLVIATRESASDFFKKTATGRSLAFNKPKFIDLLLFPSNLKGLPTVYNYAIKESTNDPCILVFMHDDLHLLDYFWYHRINDGLKFFQVLGLVGNKCRAPGQPSWACKDTSFTWDKTENLSGVLGHGKQFPPINFDIFGESRKQVKLLDGMLLAAESKTLLENNIFFDEIFKFHFYDLDFCRQAELKNISCGTWDISLMHESTGSFGTVDWKDGYKKYLEKWVE